MSFCYCSSNQVHVYHQSFTFQTPIIIKDGPRYHNSWIIGMKNISMQQKLSSRLLWASNSCPSVPSVNILKFWFNFICSSCFWVQLFVIWQVLVSLQLYLLEEFISVLNSERNEQVSLKFCWFLFWWSGNTFINNMFYRFGFHFLC